ncbi:MAG: hypothetical protein AAFX93_14040 [Verrucomicrobiota bacterium]
MSDTPKTYESAIDCIIELDFKIAKLKRENAELEKKVDIAKEAIARLSDELKNLREDTEGDAEQVLLLTQRVETLTRENTELRQNPRDEYHTMEELYEYRMLYHAHAVNSWQTQGVPVVKSRRHATGEDCFDGKYFIVVATLPTGQVSNHYKLDYWDLFDVAEVDIPPEWDGHTPTVAAERIKHAIKFLKATDEQAI